jgi:hypothetical protein
MRNAQWFADLYHHHGFSAGVHLRRIHYRLVSQEEPAAMPSGEPYRNTEQCWAVLSGASKDARYAGLVDIADFTDQRNPETVLHLAEIVEDDSNVSAGAAPLFAEPLPYSVPEPRLLIVARRPCRCGPVRGATAPGRAWPRLPSRGKLFRLRPRATASLARQRSGRLSIPAHSRKSSIHYAQDLCNKKAILDQGCSNSCVP